MTVSINGSSGIVFNDASTQNTAATGFGFKNRIINGAMVISQRGTSAFTVNDSGPYTLDRWFGEDVTDGVFTVQQDSSAPAGFNFSAKILVTTADASLAAGQYAVFTQRIEGFNTADLGWGTANAQTVTLSFWVRSSLTGTFGGVLANGAENYSYPFTYTISSANTWEQKTVTVVGPTAGTWIGATNGKGMIVTFGLGSGSTYAGTAGSWASADYRAGATGQTNVMGTLNATWYLTGVQLEKGSTATSFDYRPYGTELALCQRYYQKSYEYSIVPGAVLAADAKSLINAAWSYATTNSIANGCASFQVTMRAAPTATIYDKAGNSAKMSTQSATGTYTDNVSINQTIASESNITVQKYAQSCSGIAYAYVVSAEL